MAQEWTDDRLNVLNEKVDLGFKHVDQRFEFVDQRFDQVDQRFEQVDKRFDQVDQRFEQVDKRFERVEIDIDGLRSEMTVMQRTMAQGFMGLAGVMVTGFVALATMIVLVNG